MSFDTKDWIRPARSDEALPARTTAAAPQRMLVDEPPEVVLIEDDTDLAAGLQMALEGAGLRVHAFDAVAPALEHIAVQPPNAVLTDLYLGEEDGLTGLDALTRVKSADTTLPVVLMTARGSVTTAVEAIRSGAYDFIEKPFDKGLLLAVINRAVEQNRLTTENRELRQRLVFASGIERVLVGDSPGMRELRSMVLRVAPTPANVIILGETGAGKEMVARCLHEFSGRSGPFVAINCAAVPETLFESELFGHEAGAFTGAGKQRVGKIEHASGGTLFLDEIEAMPLHLQAKILRVLQERQVERLGGNRLVPVDLRVVAASKVDLKKHSLDDKFRLDLYYRLNVAGVKIPPLRDRREDVPLLLTHFLQDAALRLGQQPVSPSREVQQRMLAYDWPGNVRELRNAAEQLQWGIPLSIDGECSETHAGAAVPHSLEEILLGFERAVLDEALRRNAGSANAVCAELRINNSTLYRKMKAFNMELSLYRRGATQD
jgi:DNA-binding NtrC family response regulator